MIAGRKGSNGNGAAKLILRDRVLKTDLLKELNFVRSAVEKTKENLS